LNPAIAGSENCPRFSLNFRDQWPSIPHNFLTFSASYDQHLSVMHGGIGVLVSADLISNIKQTYNAGFIYNYRVEVARDFMMQFALQAGYISSSLDKTNIQLASQIVDKGVVYNELVDSLDYKSKSQFDLNFGWLSYLPYLHFGLAIHHLYPVRMNFFKETGENYQKQWAPKWTAHIGGKVTIHQQVYQKTSFGDIFFYPNLIFISQGSFNQAAGNFHYLHEGFYFLFYPITVGGWLRHNFKNLDAVIVTCGMEYKNLRIGYSYDFNLTKLEGTGGSHEVSIQYVIPCKESVNYKKGKKRYAPLTCPKF
jgi:type IX secretion system PorP/SprF family membrane protein